MKRVGVIGGGQLARMMIAPAVELGLPIGVLAEAEGAPAALATTLVGDYRDLETVRAFAATVDVVTFDHEHVPQAVLRALVADGVVVRPGPDALQYAQDKLLMRERLGELGLPVPAWGRVASPEELAAFISRHGPRVVVKTPRGGYDGKGVRVIEHAAEADDWFASLAEDGNGGSLLVEEFVEFSRELAQLVARRPGGEIALWPVVETVQKDGVCAEVVAPAPASDGPVSETAAAIAVAVAEGLDVTGVLAVELFETVDGRVLVNELAMRPHNSGHWSQDGAVTGQFEQHLRAVVDLPLGDPSPLAPAAVMINVLGGPEGQSMPDRYDRAAALNPSAKLHSYDKLSRPGRKVGHVTLIGDDAERVLADARAVAAVFAD
ncbi:5-(carboxyamino)imidazole ribonucleotide synthase [Mycetocola reblochoni]|uniref:N5-carboxyaminoimidazole ribonucleotide synthase n=2 Tax=Mycetocola reblochoni TaxID=331618 RepID=A0A1R4K051_9MICO|nr:5-(carboxyamino)imidazole ribonucleotide synthase [Mycetocola reblochoni]RLP70485.1 5-(carboxyamino)imidazole ribonucleotide synthase [Mycetocola reblochoni]SJN37720.1 Phosphoribosylaminoimidazole carboxylase ATPase subunit [Mycetocola reblochoni REB411]